MFLIRSTKIYVSHIYHVIKDSIVRKTIFTWTKMQTEIFNLIELKFKNCNGDYYNVLFKLKYKNKHWRHLHGRQRKITSSSMTTAEVQVRRPVRKTRKNEGFKKGEEIPIRGFQIPVLAMTDEGIKIGRERIDRVDVRLDFCFFFYE